MNNLAKDRENTTYDLKTVKSPILRGQALRVFVNLLEGLLGKFLIPKLLSDIGIQEFREMDVEAPPTLKPIHFVGRLATKAESVPTNEIPKKNPGSRPGSFHFATILDYADAYKIGKITPNEICERVIEAVADSKSGDRPLNAITNSIADEIYKQADASAKRHKAGNVLGPMDGVPIAVKEEINVVPYPTTLGTSFINKVAEYDATIVARLRAAGAIIIGKANMHEIGIGVTGFNPNAGTIRNPYNLNHYPGGSSSGSGAAVGSGLVPAALGADGGGSIRIPAALCGVVGLKSTYSRVSSYGVPALDWSVGHLGPLGATATDVAISWGIIAGADPNEPDSMHQPTPTLKGWDNFDLSNITLGVYDDWFNHATNDQVARNRAMLEQFKKMGAKIKMITIPNLEAGKNAHLITISSEMAQAMEEYHEEHHKEHGLDVRTNLALARSMSSRDYIKAQRVRTQMILDINNVLKEVNAIITPATGTPAPPITKGTLPYGESDLGTLTAIARFSFYANMTGLPSIAFPVGYNGFGLPLSMQATGRPWDEVTMLRLALAAEQVIERNKPEKFYQILEA